MENLNSRKHNQTHLKQVLDSDNQKLWIDNEIEPPYGETCWCEILGVIMDIGIESKQVGRRTNFSSNDSNWGNAIKTTSETSKRKWCAFVRMSLLFVVGIRSLHSSGEDDDNKTSGGDNGRSAYEWSWCCSYLVGEQRPFLDAFLVGPRLLLTFAHT